MDDKCMYFSLSLNKICFISFGQTDQNSEDDDDDNDADSEGQTAGTVQCLLMCFDLDHLQTVLGCEQVYEHQ